MKVAALFSGGKDSTYSIYKVKQLGHDVKCLVTIFPKSSNSHLLHFSAIESTELQSRTLGIPQIISMVGSTVQVMDSETFETIDIDMIEEELEGTLEQGKDIEYWNVMGRTKIMRVK